MEFEVTFCAVGILYFFRWLVSRVIDAFGNLRFSFPFRLSGVPRNWGWWRAFKHVEASWRARNSS